MHSTQIFYPDLCKTEKQGRYYKFNTSVHSKTLHAIICSKIYDVFERIRKGMAESPFQHHVVRPFYAVENSLGAEDLGVRLIKF